MDCYRQTPPQCQIGLAMDMETNSPAANFYDYDVETVNKPQQRYDLPPTIKQEPFDLDESNSGLGDFLQSEDSVDLAAYLEKIDQGNTRSFGCTGDGILRQLEFQHMVTGTSPGTPGAQSNVHLGQTSEQIMHYDNGAQAQPQQTMMQLNAHQHVQNSIPEQESVVPDDYQPWAVVDTVDVHSTATSAASSPGLPTSSEAQTPGQANSSGASKRKRPNPEPGTDEYKQKRERNNIAVRKSREKTKRKNRELQDKVVELQGENANLKKRVEGLTKELTVLKSLFTNVNKQPPAGLDRALNK